ncbi:MAG: DUF1800 domain-containing protein [Bacteroidetes bacterium]|nr:MAG: DUF1800 domain-containing protein [Bacteroidota bacterium]
MHRRNVLKRPLQAVQRALGQQEKLFSDPPAEQNPVSKYANKSLPVTARSAAGLEPYAGPWEFEQAAHLLRRTLFGPKLTEVQKAQQMGLNATLDLLLADPPLPAPPINYYYQEDPNVPVGSTWVDAEYRQGFDGYRNRSLRAWWVGLMMKEGISLREKMTLFWYNHFVVELIVVQDGRYLYRYNQMLREHALGNFKTLVENVTISPAMLRYLNGNQNTKNRPNENYGRELLELFTIGKGPIIGEGNYTNYTEEDVRQAARVLTGWRDRGYRGQQGPIRVEFRPTQHDTGDKQFSSAFGNHVISNQGETEYKALIDMIFAQAETARFICRKLYRWFVYYVIDEAAEANVIEPLAQLLISSNFELKPVLRALLGSAHFFDFINQGCVIKNPLDFVVSTVRQLDFEMPPADDFVGQYNTWLFLSAEAEKQQMAIFNPPNVAGWSAYYQEPQFYELWINSVTLPYRNQYTDRMVNGIRRQGRTIRLNPLAFVPRVSDPMDPNVLIDELARLLFPQGITEAQHTFLKDVLLPGLPDSEWVQEYGDYLANPDNENLRNAVNNRLQALLRTMFAMAEFHLS